MTAATTPMGRAAKELFAGGFYEKGKLKALHQGESQAKLAGSLYESDIPWAQINALALSVRSIGDLEEHSPEAKLTKRQTDALAALQAEKTLPAPFKQPLEAAAPKLQARRDLYALYGVLSGMLDHLASLQRTLDLEASYSQPKRR